MKIKSLLNTKNVRKTLLIIVLISSWQLLAISGLYPKLLFPDVKSILASLWSGIQSGEIFVRTGYSLYLIGAGMGIGMLLAFIITALSMVSRFMADISETLISIFDPLPGIALLPVALLWFGTGIESIIFIIVHSVIWPLVLNTYTGFRSVSRTQLEVGRNLGLTGIKLVTHIMVPASFPHILSGVKIAWARSWRALVAAEMIFGASGGQGGLGWLIYQQRYFLDIAGVFSTLVVIIVIGILVEDILLGQLEKRTIQRWGMVSTHG